ncbi:hypothetical protein MIR68_001987 [Amoeboaphelidium protococcarum]|nr:hypothetical protein MIR68_001987 [Amoeboaphelidium protococcarum]
MRIPPTLLADSYKASHYVLYPKADKMCAYGEFRHSYEKDQRDHRMVFYGMRYILETHLSTPWTMIDIEDAEKFFHTFGIGNSQHPFPKHLFTKIVTEHGGHFPVKIEALPEGSVIYPHIPVYQITAEGEFSPLVTWLETLMTMLWYPSTVATLSRRIRTVIEKAFAQSVDSDQQFLIESRLHDFGFRGCTCVEQSVIGASAHLLNFSGTDTMSGAYYTQMQLNGGSPVASSIPATEHSVMTSWPSEKEALVNLINQYGDGTFACVMDSYDYAFALEKLLPAVASIKTSKGGFLVLRPDSGDPVDTVIMALRAADKVFGSTTNSLGFKVLHGCSVIQGDGVTHQVVDRILVASMYVGYSASNVAFGMGSGLMQQIHRDTMNFATKLNYIQYSDKGDDVDHDQNNGRSVDIMKMPKTNLSKSSLPGRLAVIKDEQNGCLRVTPLENASQDENQLKVVYDHGKMAPFPKFDQVRQSLQQQWQNLPPVPPFDVRTDSMLRKINKVSSELNQRASQMKLDV